MCTWFILTCAHETQVKKIPWFIYIYNKCENKKNVQKIMTTSTSTKSEKIMIVKYKS